jgi:hypothetical protein
LHGDHFEDFFQGHVCFDHFGLDETGRDAIHCDLALCQFHRKGFGRADDAGFRSAVVDLAAVAYLA